MKYLLILEILIYYVSSIDLDTCIIKDVGPQICAQISYNLSCGYTKDGCDYIDIQTAQCTDLGINQYACLHLINQPCNWIISDNVSKCYSYIPYSNCSDTPKLVNSLVCAYVQNDSCMYNKINGSCQTPPQNQTICEIEGINNIGCIQIDGCIFQNYKCITASQQEIYTCSQLSQANKSVCPMAIDLCKYDELIGGCVQSMMNDYCNTVGISKMGCQITTKGCEWKNNSCQCIKYITTFPNCEDVKDGQICSNLGYCLFEPGNSKTSIEQYQQLQNFGKCFDKTCQDVEISQCNITKINNSICYLNSQLQCLQANYCNDIINPNQDCSLFYLNNSDCKQQNNSTQCENLICSLLTEQQCFKFNDQCIYKTACIERNCSEMNQKQCSKDNNNCFWNATSCQEQLECSSISSSVKCINNYQNGIQCGWISNETDFCTDLGCRYLSSMNTKLNCIAMHIGNQVCVRVEQSCLSCEEITDQCQCLNQTSYCGYDNNKKKCYSKNCNSFNEQSCPLEYCVFDSKYTICIPKCQYNYNKTQCITGIHCQWQDQYCIEEEVTVTQSIPTDPIFEPIISKLIKMIQFIYFIYLLI